MSVEVITKRRIELRMGLRALGTRSQILVGALEEAERRNTVEHFTIAQARRLSTALDVDLTELLVEGAQDEPAPADSRVEDQLSDRALAFLLQAFETERESGYWSDAANADLPPAEVAELLEAGFMKISSGRVVVAPRVTASLDVLSAVPQPATRTTRFSPEFASRVTSLRS
ncbi:MAG: hypothetical protein ACRDKE_00495 [Solirubrobacterales bacterium]